MSKIFEIGGDPITDDIFSWVKENRHCHDDDGYPGELVIFKPICDKIMSEDEQSIEDITKTLPSFEMGKFDPRKHYNFEEWEKVEKKRVADLKDEYKDTIKLLEELKEGRKTDIKVNIREMTVNQYIRLLHAIVEMATSISVDFVLDHNIHSVRDIRCEWKRIKRHGMFLLTSEDLSDKMFFNLQDVYYNSEYKYLTVRSSFLFYHMFKIVDERLVYLEGFGDVLEDLPLLPNNKPNADFLVEKIRKEEELNDFVIDVIIDFCNEVITDHHKLLAKLLSTNNFKADISVLETWRVMYGPYFDKARETFNKFIEAFPDVSFIYFSRFYAKYNFTTSLLPLPFYKIYISKDNQKASKHASALFDKDIFVTSEKERYDKYEH